MTTARIDPPSLSVVIPTVGRDSLLSTVDSVLQAQGADPIELIVVGKISEARIAAMLTERQQIDERIVHLAVSYPHGDSSRKKNAGWQAARSGIVAFLDDDVVVAPDWPARMVAAFSAETTALVSGPALVPPDAALFPRLAGLALSSPAAGYVAWRYRPGKSPPHTVSWSKIIGCNMAYRKRVLEEINGFDRAFWPGEEMLASFRTQQRGHRLLFDPGLWVYHDPRPTFSRFWCQIFGYGSARVRLMRAGVECEPSTLFPAALVAALTLAGIGAIWHGGGHITLLLVISGVYAAVTAVSTFLVVNQTRRAKDLLMFFIIVAMHVSYGLAGWWELIHPNADRSLCADRAANG